MTDRELQSGTSKKSRRGFLKLSGLTAGVALLPANREADFAWMTPAGRESLWTGGHAPVVKTTVGPVRGLSSGNTYAYLGVPYAQAERFAAPTAVQPWTGVRDTQGFASETAESDLHLNIWTSARASTTPRPVRVRIPGGGFNSGDSSDFNGSALAERGEAVVVSVNHRAGLLGYLNLAGIAGEEFGASNHAGNLDLAAALQWVHRNIHAFGGDPGDVTIFGGTGGEAKVSCLLHMPAARGLFHRAFLQMSTPGHQQRRGSASRFTAAILHELHLDASRARELRSLPLRTLLAAAVTAKAKLPRGVGSEFRPVADGRTLTVGLFDSPALAAQDPSLPTLISSSNTEGPLHGGHLAEDLDLAESQGPELGRLHTTHYTFMWATDLLRAPTVPNHGVEVVMTHVIGSRGKALNGRKLRTIAANAALLTMVQNPRA